MICLQCSRLGSIPGLGRFPGEGNGNPLQYSCLENPMDRRAWKGTVYGVARVGHDLATKLLLLLGPWYLIFKVDMYRTSQVVLVVKNPSANAGDIRDTGLIPGWRTSLGGGNVNPLQYSCLENPINRGAWWATVHRVAKRWTWLKQRSTIGFCHSEENFLPWYSYNFTTLVTEFAWSHVQNSVSGTGVDWEFNRLPYSVRCQSGLLRDRLECQLRPCHPLSTWIVCLPG